MSAGGAAERVGDAVTCEGKPWPPNGNCCPPRPVSRWEYSIELHVRLLLDGERTGPGPRAVAEPAGR
jgi:hypothetical protein